MPEVTIVGGVVLWGCVDWSCLQIGCFLLCGRIYAPHTPPLAVEDTSEHSPKRLLFTQTLNKFSQSWKVVRNSATPHPLLRLANGFRQTGEEKAVRFVRCSLRDRHLHHQEP